MHVMRILPIAAVAGVLTAAGCGPSSGQSTSSSSGSTTTPTADATTADPASMLLQPSEVPSGFTATAAAHDFGGPLDSTGLQRTFGDAASQAGSTMRDGAEATYSQSSNTNTEVAVKDFVFTTAADAQAVWSGYLQEGGQAVATPQPLPSGAPGEQQQLYDENVGDFVALAYLFREGNVLAEVDIDAPPGQYSDTDVIALATKQDAHIRATLR